MTSGKSGGRGGGSLLLPSACGMAGDSGGGGRKSWNVCLDTIVSGGIAWPLLQFIFIEAVGNDTGGLSDIKSFRDGKAFAMIFSFMDVHPTDSVQVIFLIEDKCNIFPQSHLIKG